MRRELRKPLYRKVNTKARGVRHHFGGDYRHHRNTKNPEAAKMARGRRRGLDYTPLFMFLLSKVGRPWGEVFSEAVARLDRREPIFWMVSLSRDMAKAYFAVGGSSYFSGLYVDEEGLLRKVDPTLDETRLAPSCKCCTHTFNGKPFTRRFREGSRGGEESRS